MPSENTSKRIELLKQKIKDYQFEIEMIEEFIAFAKYKIKELQMENTKGKTMGGEDDGG